MKTKQKASQIVNIILWLAQGILAVTLIWAGYMKIFKPGGLPFPWVKDHGNLVLLTGIIDLLAGIGIVLPAVLCIKSKLTVLTAYGIVILMAAACFFHMSRGEAKDIGFNIFMLILAFFVAWGRQRVVPITDK